MDILKQCNDAFGLPPRRFSLWQWHTYLKARKPPWMRKRPKDPLNAIYSDQRALFSTGRVVWGQIVQANNLLFKPGRADSPADVVYSFDPALEPDAAINFLGDLAKRLFKLKGTRPRSPGLAQFARAITGERERTPRREIPAELTGGPRIYHTTIMAVRKHLPRGYLVHGYFPLVASPELPWTMILPARFWPRQLRDFWRG